MEGAIRSDGELSVGLAPADAGRSWNRFVDRHPATTYAHRFEWRRVVERAYRRRTRYLVARRGSDIAGLLPLVWMPGALSGHRLISVPYLDLGGPLALDDTVTKALLEGAREEARRLGARGVELREAEPAGSSAPTGDRFRFLLDLPRSSDDLWSSIGPKVRNQIRKARKSGLATHRVGADRLPTFYGVFARNMRDLGSPVHSPRFLERIFESFGDDARLYLTLDESGRAVAGAIGLRHGPTLTVPWASAVREARPLCPNHSLYWSLLETAVDEGLERFDFGRSTRDTGTYRFKKQWGATPVALAWRRLDGEGSRPLLAAKPGRAAALAVALWRRLPLGLANAIGPRVRGRLPQ